MAGLEGTVKLPGFGPVQKKTVLYGGAAVVALGVVVAYRHKNAAAAPAANPNDAEIDPATGFPYGSPEDLAALQAQGNYTMPVSPGGGGSGSIPNGGTGFATNGAWSQGVIDYMLHNGLIEDPTALSAALGVYLTGSYATDAQVSLIEQAIAVEGYPPVNGSTGYPPSINRTPPQSSGGNGTPTTPPPVNNDPTLPAPTGLHVTSIDRTGASLDWDPVSGAIGYKTYIGKTQVGNTVTYSNAYVYNLKPGTKYSVIVYPVNKSNRNGWWSTVTFTTKK